jgi:hypothetical protein
MKKLQFERTFKVEVIPLWLMAIEEMKKISILNSYEGKFMVLYKIVEILGCENEKINIEELLP